ncbi:hypothetical protein K7X08_022941 [Anisodus acutangulus]|uniref:Uncharacterized protein n=1 Tax=Anisodus acutangulus TaxID=402998 RepID=A0A9Q1MBJ2_9SOLA|nr:hypothetical protein K7X08_022941 [Anisodus acutangulus]
MSVKSCVTKSGYNCGFLVEESDDDAIEGQRAHGVTATKSGGNKRSRETEDVNWDKRRRLKMLFYLAAEGLYLSQTKDPSYGKEEMDTQSDEMTEVFGGQNGKNRRSKNRSTGDLLPKVCQMSPDSTGSGTGGRPQRAEMERKTKKRKRGRKKIEEDKEEEREMAYLQRTSRVSLTGVGSGVVRRGR